MGRGDRASKAIDTSRRSSIGTDGLLIDRDISINVEVTNYIDDVARGSHLGVFVYHTAAGLFGAGSGSSKGKGSMQSRFWHDQEQGCRI